MNPLRGYLDCAVRLMTNDESSVMIGLLIRQSALPDALHLELLSQSQSYACLFGRIEWAGFAKRVDRKCFAFISTFCGIPGQLVMWALTFALIATQRGRCDFDAFVHAFPNGIPTHDAMRLAWEAQKDAENRNRVDRLEEWPKSESEVAA